MSDAREWAAVDCARYKRPATWHIESRSAACVCAWVRDTVMQGVCVLFQVSWKKECLVLHVLRGLLGRRARRAAVQAYHCGVCLTIDVYSWCSCLKNKERSFHLVHCSSLLFPLSCLKNKEHSFHLVHCSSLSFPLSRSEQNVTLTEQDQGKV